MPAIKDGKPLIKDGKPAISENPCTCCGGAAAATCKCFPLSGTVRKQFYDSSGTTIESEETGVGAGFSFASEWWDITRGIDNYGHVGGTTCYATAPWHTTPQKIELKISVVGTSVDSYPDPGPTSAPGGPVYMTVTVEMRAEHVLFINETDHHVEGDYYAGSRYPYFDFIGASSHGGMTFIPPADETPSSPSTTITTPDLTTTGTVKYKRSTTTFTLTWSANTVGNYRIVAGHCDVVQAINPNSSGVVVNYTIPVEFWNGSAWVFSYNQTKTVTYNRGTGGAIAELTTATISNTVIRSFNAYQVVRANPADAGDGWWGGKWRDLMQIGDAIYGGIFPTVTLLTQTALFPTPWQTTTPSGASVSKVTTLLGGQTITWTRLLAIHSLEPNRRGESITFRLEADTFVARFIASGTTPARPGEFTATAYHAVGRQVSVPMVYPGGEDVPTVFNIGGTDYSLGALDLPMSLTWTTGITDLDFVAEIINVPATFSETEITWAAGGTYVSTANFDCGISWSSGSQAIPSGFGSNAISLTINMTIDWYYVYTTDTYDGGPTGLSHDATAGGTATIGAPNPVLVKIDSDAGGGGVVAVVDTVTHIRVSGAWVAPGGDYLATPAGYPAALDLTLGAASTDDASITIEVKSGGAVIGTGVIDSHFAGIDAGTWPATVNITGCTYTLGTDMVFCGHKLPLISWDPFATVDSYTVERFISAPGYAYNKFGEHYISTDRAFDNSDSWTSGFEIRVDNVVYTTGEHEWGVGFPFGGANGTGEQDWSYVTRPEGHAVDYLNNMVDGTHPGRVYIT